MTLIKSMKKVNDLDYNIIDDDSLVLTTVDNPFNPKDDYLQWRRWDIKNGYHTEEYLARMSDVPEDVENDSIIRERESKAVALILQNDTLNIYTLV